MILKMFSIYDMATESFNTPFFMLTEAEAMRVFTNMANDEGTQINKNPLDFKLYRLGDYDNQTGTVEAAEPVRCLGVAKQFKNMEEVEVKENVQ